MKTLKKTNCAPNKTRRVSNSCFTKQALLMLKKEYNKDTKNINYLQEVDKHLVVPVNKKIRFLLTSNDVLHAWWVPDLALKRDAIPGYINEMSVVINEPGIYRGRCAELCGRHHGFMPIVIEAVEEKEYEEWLANADKVKSSDVAKINK